VVAETPNKEIVQARVVFMFKFIKQMIFRVYGTLGQLQDRE
jgi:hypothetical protein